MPARRTLVLMGGLVPVLALFLFVVLRSGPMAPVPVTVTEVEDRVISPEAFGIGTVEARYTYRIGPTAPGRVKSVLVQVGDRVRAGQLLGEMDPVDLDARILAQGALLGRTEASVIAARAQVSAASARQVYAEGQDRRHEQLLLAGSISREAADATRQERQAGDANLLAARAGLEAADQDLARARADHRAAVLLRASLRLEAPVAGLVVSRDVDPGTSVVAGQPVVEVIDPASLWIDVRFDQQRTSGLRAGAGARIVLRSQPGRPIAGRLLRIEPRADAVTEELRAKVALAAIPDPLPPVGELAEVTVSMPVQPKGPVVPNASIQRVGGRLGVWQVRKNRLLFTPVKLGASDLEGRVRILEGLKSGERVVVHSQRALGPGSRIRIVKRLSKAPS